MDNHQNFLKAIAEKKIVKLRFNARQKGIIERSCIPYDFGPSKIFLSPNPSRYHFYDLDSPNGAHNLSIMIEQVILIEITEQNYQEVIEQWQKVKKDEKQYLIISIDDF